MSAFDKAYEELAGLSTGDRPQIAGAPSRPGTVSKPGTASSSITRGVLKSPGAGGSALEKYPAKVTAAWRSGPTDHAGVMESVSERPCLCSAANWARGEVVVGSSDHALYVIDAAKGTRKRTLYSKTGGHTEWVSTVAILPDGKIVSGGQDSRMWLWGAGSAKGIQMDGHFGAISKVEYDPSSGGVVSASYDKSVRVWSVGARGTEQACLMGHDAPILELSVNSSGRIVSGDRSGNVLLWDPQGACETSWRMKHVHAGHITSLVWADESDSNLGGTFVSGGQDGVVRVWDPRAKSCPAKVQLHVNEDGHGAVSQICAGGPAAAGYIVTSGADGTVRVLDPRKSFALMSTMQLTDFPYSMAVAGGLAVIGCGDGSLHVADIASGATLYALGAHQGAVRTIDATTDRVITSGDDGNTMLYRF